MAGSMREREFGPVIVAIIGFLFGAFNVFVGPDANAKHSQDLGEVPGPLLAERIHWSARFSFGFVSIFLGVVWSPMR